MPSLSEQHPMEHNFANFASPVEAPEDCAEDSAPPAGSHSFWGDTSSMAAVNLSRMRLPA